MTYQKYSVTGFSLIEVLVALLVFSIGLIGLAGLLVMSTQANHGAFIRTQATFLGQSMADRMSANPIGVWNNDYNASDYPQSAGSSSAPACDASNPCKPSDVATRDRLVWSQMLKQFMPDDASLNASITCTPAAGTATIIASVPDFYAKRPPYNGTCAMNITWTERSLAIGGSASPQTFSWVFQP